VLDRDEDVDDFESRLARPVVGRGQLGEKREPELGCVAQDRRERRDVVARGV